MKSSQLILILLTVLALSAGQVLFKLAAEQITLSPDGWLLTFPVFKLSAALIIYVVATGMWLAVLHQTPLRVAYPYAALVFVLVPLFAHFLLGEAIHWNTLVGAVVILTGVWISALK